MAIKTVKLKHRIEIDVETSRYGREHSDKEIRDYADNIMAQIKRHVDLGNSENPIYKYDSEEQCEFCERTDCLASDGSPECCEKAMAEFVNQVGIDKAASSVAFGDDRVYAEKLSVKYAPRVAST